MNPLKIEIVAALLAAALLAGIVGGWTMNGWRQGARVEKLKGVVDTQKQGLATLEGANKRCVAGVAEVQTAVKGFVDAGNKRAGEAAAAMKAAAVQAQGHLQDARDAMSRPPVVAGKECEGVAAEASAYAKKRKAAP